MTAIPVNENTLRDLTDEGLAHFYAFWLSRLNHPGTSYVAALLRDTARVQLEEIEAALKAKEPA